MAFSLLNQSIAQFLPSSHLILAVGQLRARGRIPSHISLGLQQLFLSSPQKLLPKLFITKTLLAERRPSARAQASSTTLWMASRRRPSPKRLVRGAARMLPLALMFSAVLWTRMEATKSLTMSTVVVARHVVGLYTCELNPARVGLV